MSRFEKVNHLSLNRKGKVTFEHAPMLLQGFITLAHAFVNVAARIGKQELLH